MGSALGGSQPWANRHETKERRSDQISLRRRDMPTSITLRASIHNLKPAESEPRRRCPTRLRDLSVSRE